MRILVRGEQDGGCTVALGGIQSPHFAYLGDVLRSCSNYEREGNMNSTSNALTRVAALEAEIGSLRSELTAHRQALATILRGGLVELSTADVTRDPVSGLAARLTTSHRVVLDQQSMFVERRQCADLADVQTQTLRTLTAAVAHTERASATAHRVETLVGDLLAIAKRLAAIHGLEVVVSDGRATLDAVAGDPLTEAARTFAGLARQAAANAEREIQRAVKEQIEFMRWIR